jgi:hypothetical protein
MPGYWFDLGKELLRFRLEDRNGKIGPRKRAYCVEGLEEVHYDEFNFVLPVLPENMPTSIACDAP